MTSDLVYTYIFCLIFLIKGHLNILYNNKEPKVIRILDMEKQRLISLGKGGRVIYLILQSLHLCFEHLLCKWPENDLFRLGC